MQLAEAVRAKRIVEVQNGEHGFKTSSKLKANFYDYFQKLCDEKLKATSKTGSGISITDSVLRILMIMNCHYYHREHLFWKNRKSVHDEIRISVHDGAVWVFTIDQNQCS